MCAERIHTPGIRDKQTAQIIRMAITRVPCRFINDARHAPLAISATNEACDNYGLIGYLN